MTGGQANLIAGIKSGSKGLDDQEKGEIFVQVLERSCFARGDGRAHMGAGNIYGLNNTGLEDIREGRFPRYRRWRLEAIEPVTQGSFLFALSPRRARCDMPRARLLPDPRHSTWIRPIEGARRGV